MKKQLQKRLAERVQLCVSRESDARHICTKIEKKKRVFRKRSAHIVKAKALGKINKSIPHEDTTEVYYSVHFQYVIRHKGLLYMEEEIESRKAEFYKSELVEDQEHDVYLPEETADWTFDPKEEVRERLAYQYDRLKAVQYAERWWNDYNPAYKKFEVDCTNYISQCLHAGGAPMRGYPNRGRGWWLRNHNWSYSWAVANSLRLYLLNSNSGLRAREVNSPDQLLPGDVICYDFQGDGRFDHNTIVTALDADGLPLVNAHTTNSRMRYWAYEDSTAYTPNIKYKFFSIMDG